MPFWKIVLPVLGTGSHTERVHRQSRVYDEDTEVDHRCLITSNVKCLAMTAKHETLKTLLSEDRRQPGEVAS